MRLRPSGPILWTKGLQLKMTEPQTDNRQGDGKDQEEKTISVFNAQTGLRLRFPFRRKVHRLLKDLKLDPETVLVIQGDQLLTQDEDLSAEMEVEIRPVISGGAS
jgi:sulfur carrier protein